MIIKAKYQIDKVASKDPLRPAINHIAIGRNKAVATNGHSLVVIPCETFPDEKKKVLMDVLALKESAVLNKGKYDKGYRNIVLEEKGATIRPKSKLAKACDITLNYIDETFPKLFPILYNAKRVKQNKDMPVCFNINTMKNVADALGTESIRIIFQASKTMTGLGSYIVVEPALGEENQGQWGIVMKVRDEQ